MLANINQYQFQTSLLISTLNSPKWDARSKTVVRHRNGTSSAQGFGTGAARRVNRRAADPPWSPFINYWLSAWGGWSGGGGYKENPEKNGKNVKIKKHEFCNFRFLGGFRPSLFFHGFPGRFQYRTPRFHSSSPDPDSFSAENVFFFVILAVFSLSLFASLRLWNSETLRLWNS